MKLPKEMQNKKKTKSDIKRKNFNFMNYEQPFENMVGITAYVIGHALEILYFESGITLDSGCHNR